MSIVANLFQHYAQLHGRRYVWTAEPTGRVCLYRQTAAATPWIRPEQWLVMPVVVEEYPGMALLADGVQHEQPWPTLISREGVPVGGRVLVVGVLAQGRQLVSLTTAEVARLALVGLLREPGPRQLQLLPCASGA